MEHPIPEKLIRTVREARSVVVLTGAGVSAESGVPTFRDGLTGLWAKFDPAQLATPQAFEKDPGLVARWYDQRRVQCAALQPNPGHLALARWEQAMTRGGLTFTLLTQNVDRLHQKASSGNVVELHGTIWVWRCTRCGKGREENGPAFETHPPLCECRGSRRPGVVWFGESLPPQAIETADRVSRTCDLFLAVGTSGQVWPAAGLLGVAHEAGATTVEINPQETPLTPQVDFSIRGPSGSLLPALVEAAFPGSES